MKVVATDSLVAALSVAIAVTLMCTSSYQHCQYHCCARFRCHSAVHIVISALSVPLLCSFSLSQRCAHRHISTVSTTAVLVFPVTALCTSSYQHCQYHCCARFRCHSAVHIVISALSVPLLCSFSLSQRCAHRHISTVSTTAVLVFAVTALCTSSYQHCQYHCCARFRCHSAVHIVISALSVPLLCSFSLSQPCAHRHISTVSTTAVLVFAVTALCTSSYQHCQYHCCARFHCHSAVHIVISALSVPLLCSFSLSQRCVHRHISTVSTTAVLVFAVTALCTSSYQHCQYHCCARFRCHMLCSFSLSQRSAHRCLTAVGFLLYNPSYKDFMNFVNFLNSVYSL